MNNLELNQNEKANLRFICKFTSVVFAIAKVALYIAIVCLIFTASLTPSIISHTSVKNNELIFKYDEDIMAVTFKNDKAIFKYNGEEKTSNKESKEVLSYYKDVLSEHSKSQIIALSESMIIVAVVELIFLSIIFKSLSKLFKNIAVQNTPFNDDNVECLSTIFKYMIPAFILPLVETSAFVFAGFEDTIHVSYISIFSVVISYVALKLFKYATLLQKESNKTIY
ncbi:MAG: DUF2975 domain-containing protein [Bacilli bacterium]|nr:DUF2975 domain-containing protein [Bacilli bacterium]